MVQNPNYSDLGQHSVFYVELAPAAALHEIVKLQSNLNPQLISSVTLYNIVVRSKEGLGKLSP